MKHSVVKRELGSLTGLRFLAALLVFIFHIQLQIGTPYLKFRLDNIVSQGALGVNLFFVLSGFLLTYSGLKDFQQQSSISWSFYKKFFIKRLARIYPAYLCGLFLFWLVSIIFESYPENFSIVVFLDIFMIQSFFPGFEMAWYGGGGWSVSVEIFFYLLFPFFLPLFLYVKKKNHLLVILAVLIIIATIPGALHNIYPDPMMAQHVYAFAPLRLPEFLCGIVTGILVFQFN